MSLLPLSTEMFEHAFIPPLFKPVSGSHDMPDVLLLLGGREGGSPDLEETLFAVSNTPVRPPPGHQASSVSTSYHVELQDFRCALSPTLRGLCPSLLLLSIIALSVCPISHSAKHSAKQLSCMTSFNPDNNPIQ